MVSVPSPSNVWRGSTPIFLVLLSSSPGSSAGFTASLSFWGMSVESDVSSGSCEPVKSDGDMISDGLGMKRRAVDGLSRRIQSREMAPMKTPTAKAPIIAVVWFSRIHDFAISAGSPPPIRARSIISCKLDILPGPKPEPPKLPSEKPASSNSVSSNPEGSKPDEPDPLERDPPAQGASGLPLD